MLYSRVVPYRREPRIVYSISFNKLIYPFRLLSILISRDFTAHSIEIGLSLVKGSDPFCLYTDTYVPFLHIAHSVAVSLRVRVRPFCKEIAGGDQIAAIINPNSAAREIDIADIITDVAHLFVRRTVGNVCDIFLRVGRFDNLTRVWTKSISLPITTVSIVCINRVVLKTLLLTASLKVNLLILEQHRISIQFDRRIGLATLITCECDFFLYNRLLVLLYIRRIVWVVYIGIVCVVIVVVSLEFGDVLLVVRRHADFIILA